MYEQNLKRNYYLEPFSVFHYIKMIGRYLFYPDTKSIHPFRLDQHNLSDFQNNMHKVTSKAMHWLWNVRR